LQIPYLGLLFITLVAAAEWGQLLLEQVVQVVVAMEVAVRAYLARQTLVVVAVELQQQAAQAAQA
jgi:hypothetical protein